jgi:hypothetical protein
MLPTHTHTQQFKIGLIQATGSQIPTVPGVSRHVSLCRIPWLMSSFPPIFKLRRVENMNAAVNHFVHHLGIVTLSQLPWKLILLCLAIIQMSNKLQNDIMMSSYIPDPISHKIFIHETAKMCNWENYIATIFCELEKDQYYSCSRVEHFHPAWWKPTQRLVVWEPWLMNTYCYYYYYYHNWYRHMTTVPFYSQHIVQWT